VIGDRLARFRVDVYFGKENTKDIKGEKAGNLGG